MTSFIIEEWGVGGGFPKSSPGLLNMGLEYNL